MSSLDTQLRIAVRGEIKSFARKMGLTMIYVTHDHNEGLYMADRAGIMYSGEMEAVKPPRDIFTHPDSERTAKFFGYNVVTIGEKKVAFYPSDFEITDQEADLRGTVTSMGFEGEYERAYIDIGKGESVQLELLPGMHGGLQPGSEAGIRIKRMEELNG